MGASRGITLTISVDDDDPTTTTDLIALADVVTEAALQLLPGSTTRLVVLASPGAPVLEPEPPRPRYRRGTARPAAADVA
ncbi:hypothetical protein [Kineococcus glutinatus]|uniref:Uncharacterized protein n=1 Tax=Kineococcus glutinatus TaxID=1070872 RepID=A0ABP9H7D7_9ACTN